jgi:hypothetical protein
MVAITWSAAAVMSGVGDAGGLGEFLSAERSAQTSADPAIHPGAATVGGVETGVSALR